jgi:hypothetical protein
MANLIFATGTISRIASRELEEVTFRFDKWHETEGFPNTDSEWIKVDSILAGPRFATLKGIRIYTIGRLPNATSPSALFATLLPTCHARGILSFIDLPHPSQLIELLNLRPLRRISDV